MLARRATASGVMRRSRKQRRLRCANGRHLFSVAILAVHLPSTGRGIEGEGWVAWAALALLLSRIDAFAMGSAPASGAVAGASPATTRRIKNSHRSVSGDAAVPTGEGAGWMRPGRARSPFLTASFQLRYRLRCSWRKSLANYHCPSFCPTQPSPLPVEKSACLEE